MSRSIFPFETRKHLLEKITEGKNVEVVKIDGLLADFVKQNEVDFLVVDS